MRRIHRHLKLENWWSRSWDIKKNMFSTKWFFINILRTAALILKFKVSMDSMVGSNWKNLCSKCLLWYNISIKVKWKITYFYYCTAGDVLSDFFWMCSYSTNRICPWVYPKKKQLVHLHTYFIINQLVRNFCTCMFFSFCSV